MVELTFQKYVSQEDKTSNIFIQYHFFLFSLVYDNHFFDIH